MTEILYPDGVFQLWPAATVAIAAALIGFASGGLPGVASLAAPVLTLAIPFEQAQAIVLPVFLYGQLIGTIVHRKHIHWPELAYLVLLSSLGILIGWMIWSLMLERPEFPVIRQWLKGLTACLILVLAVNLYRTRIQEPPAAVFTPGLKAGMVWCVLAGVLSTIANVSGSLVVWFLSTRHLRKEQLTSTIAASYLIINALKIIPYTALGFYDQSQPVSAFRQDAVIWIPVLLLTTIAMLIGRWRLHRTTQKRFNLALITAMVVVACGTLLQTVQQVFEADAFSS